MSMNAIIKYSVCAANRVAGYAMLFADAPLGEWTVFYARKASFCVVVESEPVRVHEGCALIAKSALIAPADAAQDGESPFEADVLTLSRSGGAMGVDLSTFRGGMCLSKFDSKTSTAIRFYFEFIATLVSQGDESARQDLVAGNLELLLKLIDRGRVTGDYETNDDASIERKVLVVKEFIDSRYMEEISLQRLANEFFISPDYLSHVYKEHIGSSPINYLIMVRIGHAKKLLLTSDLSVQEIAKSVGYNNANYFSILFRKATGLSPTTFALVSNRDY